MDENVEIQKKCKDSSNGKSIAIHDNLSSVSEISSDNVMMDENIAVQKKCEDNSNVESIAIRDHLSSVRAVSSANVKMDENVEVQKKCEDRPNDETVTIHDNFLVDLLSRDAADESCVEKDKTLTERKVMFEEKESNDHLISNVVTSEDKLKIVSELKDDVTTEKEIHKLVEEEDILSESEHEVMHLKAVEEDMECSANAEETNIEKEDSLSSKSEVLIIKEISIQETSKSNIENQQPAEQMSNTFSQSKYRCESDNWTDDDDSSTSDSSSDSDFFQDVCEKSKPKIYPSAKTKGELGLDDLPPIEDLIISVNESEMTAIGKVHAIVEKLVVIHSIKGMKALDLESVLFLSHDQPLGRVFDVLGPVNEPFYTVRFNSEEQINEKGVKIGAEVFFAPEKSDITSYVFVEKLKNQKGSDASWKHNNEPPVECLDFSDDEEEKNARRQRRFKNRNQEFSNNVDTPAKRPLLEGNSSNFIPPPKPASPWNHSQNVSFKVSSPNPFQTCRPLPPSPSPSVRSFMSPVRLQNSFVSPTSQPQRLAQPQNILYRSPPPLVVSPFQQPHHIFGQVTVVNHLSPVLHRPHPLPSPVMNTMPALIPSSTFPAPQNYFNQTFPRNPSPVSHNQHMSLDPWHPNSQGQSYATRSMVSNSANVPPSHPLTVQIPNLSSPPPLPMQQFPVQRPVQQFVNIQNGNFNQPFVNGIRNFPPLNVQPRFYHS